MSLRRVILVSVVSILVFTPVSWARTWYVNPDGTGDAPTIQAAVDSAGSGDTILLADGVYVGDGNRDITYRGRSFAIESESADPELCIIDCGGSEADPHLGFWIDGTYEMYEEVRMEGITICHGYGDDAAVRCINCTLLMSNCILTNNNSPAVRCGRGPGTEITDCTFSHNGCDPTGSVCGGALTVTEDCRIANCIFTHNRGSRGAALKLFGEGPGPEIVGCTFSNNEAGTCGGAIFIYHGSPIIRRCVFLENTADLGGAISVWGIEHYDTNPRVLECVFWGNSAGESGGAIWEGIPLGIPMAAEQTLTVVSCTIVGNSAPEGSGIALHAEYSILLPPDSLENSILAYNEGGAAVECWVSYPGYVPVVTCCDIYGNAGGNWVDCLSDLRSSNGNFSRCPSFCGVGMGDYYLCDDSPCLPGNHPHGYDCGLIGARGEGCVCGPSRTEPTTWGAIKSMYR